MELLIGNSLLYLCTLIYAYKRKLSIDIGIILILFYALVSIGGIFYYCQAPQHWNLTLIPFIYLYIIFIICSRPFLKEKIVFPSFSIQSINFFRVLLWVMIIAGLISVFYSFERGIRVAIVGNYFDVYSEEDKVQLIYVNQLDRFVKNLQGYGKLVTYLVAFFFLTRENKKDNIIAILAIVLTFASSVLVSFIIASRGLIFKQLISLGCALMLSWVRLPKMKQNIIKILGIFITIFYIIYLYIVSDARFSMGNTYTVEESLYAYWGQPMLLFDNGLMDSISKHMWGDYIFGLNKHLYSCGLDSALGTHFGTGFFTFVGAFYLDFGFVGTLLISIFLMLYFNQKKSPRDFADIYILCFYFSFLADGVRVVGKGYFLSWLMAFITYRFLKIIN